MKLLNRSPKVLAAILGLGSLVVFAGTLSDLRLHSDAFMDNVKIEVPTKTGRIKTQRFVASSEQSDLPAVEYLPFNSQNQELINGKWEIRRIKAADDTIVYDKVGSYEDRNKSIVVDFSLIGTSTVMVDNDANQVFKISLMTDYDTIALFKIMDDGYEILEAKKVPETQTEVVADVVETQDKEESDEKANGLRLEENVDLRLERALFPSKTSELLKGDKIRGHVSLIDGNIESLSAAIYYDDRSPAEEIDIPFAEINDGGMFEAFMGNESVHGIITNNGEGVFRIRFATGPLQGAMLNFVTDEKMMQIQDEQYQRTAEYEEAQDFREDNYPNNNTEVYDQESVDQKQMDYENARIAEEDEYARNNESINKEEMDERVEQSGYSF